MTVKKFSYFAHTGNIIADLGLKVNTIGLSCKVPDSDKKEEQYGFLPLFL